MRLNRLESWVVNSGIRLWYQKKVEARILGGLLVRPFDAGRVLVIGCGRGVEIEIAIDRFGAGRVDAFDLDPRQIVRARKRVGRRVDRRVCMWLGSATRVPTGDSQYNAVIDWGVFHHIPDWRSALDEVARTLKPGGQFLFLEVPRHKLVAARYRLLFDHPLEDRFELDDFNRECGRRGLKVGARTRDHFGFFFGVAVKAAPDE